MEELKVEPSNTQNYTNTVIIPSKLL